MFEPNDKLTNSEAKRSRQKRRFERTRAKLVEAARAVFTERGLGASVDEIAERADVARGSFYYHFKTKNDLIAWLMEDILSGLIERMERDCADRQGLEATLDGIIQAHIGFFAQRWSDFVLYYQGRADLTLESSSGYLTRPFLRYVGSIESLIDASIAEPISDLRLRRVASAIAGFVSGYYSIASIASTEQDIDKEFMSLRKAFVASLARFAREAIPDNPVRW